MTREVVKVFIVFLVTLSACTYAQDELRGSWPEGGGPISIQTLGGPIQTNGLDVKASGPYLSNGSNPAPWAFYISGNDKSGVTQVVLGSLGSVPTLDGQLTLDVTVSAAAGCDDIATELGNGLFPSPFPTSKIGCVPEPSTGALATFALVFLLYLRPRRPKRPKH